MPDISFYSWEQYNTTVEPWNLGWPNSPEQYLGETFTYTGGPPKTISVLDDDASFDDGNVDNGVNQTLEQAITFNGETYPAGSVVELEMSLSDASGAQVYVVRINNENVGFAYAPGDDHAVNEDYIPQSGVDNTSVDYANISNLSGSVCFAAKTRILTPSGEQLVETLQIGDPILTADNGPQAILWIGRQNIRFDDDNRLDALRPVLFSEGSLEPGKPNQNLVVSPQHRLLLKGTVVRDIFGVAEVFAPAIGLLDLPGVRLMAGKRTVSYVHLLTKRHEVLHANGAASETLYPGVTAMAMMPSSHRREIRHVVPGLGCDPTTAYGPTARPCLTRRDAKALVHSMMRSRAYGIA